MSDVDLKNPEGIKSAFNKGLKFLKPPEDLMPSEYAERNLRIPAGNALPGPVRFRNAPHQIEPLNLIDDPECERITLMWGAQTGKTQTALMAKAYFIGHKPKNMMAMQASKADLGKWLNGKFDPMVQSTPLLEDRIAKARGREGVNNQNMKSYPGGSLTFAWSGSPKTMRGVSAGIIFPDETDGYDRTKEGHPVSILWQRAATFGDDKLLFETSTPTLKETSYIEGAFEAGDGRRWHVDCPDCGHSQYLKWSQVNWTQTDDGVHLPDTARYSCEDCGSLWDDEQRVNALRKGEWIAEREFYGHASFHLPEMASCFVRLKDVVKSFLTKKAMGDLQTFTNVSLAETWEEKGASVSPAPLYARREHYAAAVPEKALVLTAAVDVQDDRLELQVEAHGAGEENWKIDFDIFRGDPSRDELWKRLDEALNKKYRHESGVMLGIKCTCIDSGGHFTSQVYKFCKRREASRVFAIKGRSTDGSPVVGRPSKSNKGGVTLFPIGTDTAKEIIYKRLSILEPGSGYIHFPVSDKFDEEWFEQLTAEECLTKYREGKPYRKWVQKRKRNEAFDLSVYNLAALYILNPNFDALSRSFEPIRMEEPTEQQRTTQRRRPQRKKRNWATDI